MQKTPSTLAVNRQCSSLISLRARITANYLLFNCVYLWQKKLLLFLSHVRRLGQILLEAVQITRHLALVALAELVEVWLAAREERIHALIRFGRSPDVR